MRPAIRTCVTVAIVGVLGAGCIHYSQKSSSRSGQAGWGGGGGGAGAGGLSGSSSGSGWGHDPHAQRVPSPAQPQYGGVPTAPTGMAMDPSLGLWRMNDAPNVFYDGRAYYTKTPDGWMARLDPAHPWQPVTIDVIPPALRRF